MRFQVSLFDVQILLKIYYKTLILVFCKGLCCPEIFLRRRCGPRSDVFSSFIAELGLGFGLKLLWNLDCLISYFFQYFFSKFEFYFLSQFCFGSQLRILLLLRFDLARQILKIGHYLKRLLITFSSFILFINLMQLIS